MYHAMADILCSRLTIYQGRKMAIRRECSACWDPIHTMLQLTLSQKWQLIRLRMPKMMLTIRRLIMSQDPTGVLIVWKSGEKVCFSWLTARGLAALPVRKQASFLMALFG